MNKTALSEHITRSGPVTGRASGRARAVPGAGGLVGRVGAAATLGHRRPTVGAGAIAARVVGPSQDLAGCDATVASSTLSRFIRKRGGAQRNVNKPGGFGRRRRSAALLGIFAPLETLGADQCS